MNVYLIRHTKIAYKKGEVAYGQTDMPLAPTFMEEAKIVKKEFEQLPPYDAIFSSPLTRALKLANYCTSTEQKIVQDDRLKEINLGEYELKTWGELLKGREVLDFLTHHTTNAFPQGESFNDQLNRVNAFLKEKKEQNYQTIVAFVHAGVINCVRYLNGDIKDMSHILMDLPDYGSINYFHYKDKG